MGVCAEGWQKKGGGFVKAMVARQAGVASKLLEPTKILWCVVNSKKKGNTQVETYKGTAEIENAGGVEPGQLSGINWVTRWETIPHGVKTQLVEGRTRGREETQSKTGKGRKTLLVTFAGRI